LELSFALLALFLMRVKPTILVDQKLRALILMQAAIHFHARGLAVHIFPPAVALSVIVARVASGASDTLAIERVCPHLRV
jgi:hypothetical protein